MNEEFRKLYARLKESENHDQYQDAMRDLVELVESKDLSEGVLETTREELNVQNWSSLNNLIGLMQNAPNRKYTPILCELLDYRHFDLMEGIADALFDIVDERAVPYVIKTLLGYDFDEDLIYHLRIKLIDFLIRIGNKEAIDGLKLLSQNPIEVISREAKRGLEIIQRGHPDNSES